MASSRLTSTTFSYFVLTDSHGKFVPSTITTPSHSITIKAVSGLKWIDNYNANLCALTLLSSSSLSFHLSSAKAIMLLIGTNSIRCTPPSSIIMQVTTIINLLRDTYSHLSDKHCINVVVCFPCFKPLYPLTTYYSLLDNIAEYNTLLFNLSLSLNFTVVDFHILNHHIGTDRMHLDFRYNTLVKNSIMEYFDALSTLLITPPSKIIGRSQEAKARRNKRRHLKQIIKHQQHYLIRSIDSSWSITSIKKYLNELKIKFAKIPPIYRNTLRIQFNNQNDLQTAASIVHHAIFLQKVGS